MSGVYVFQLRERLAVPLVAVPVRIEVVPVAVEAVTYGRRAGDRIEYSVSHDVHFADVYALDGVVDPRDDHGTDITDALFATGKAA